MVRLEHWPKDTRVRQLKTYLVENSNVIRDNLVATLEELLPAKVVGVAGDAATAVQWLAEEGNACDLWIVDIFLNEGSGLNVLSAIRERRTDVKVVVLTNYATGPMRRKCMDLGADRVFDKSNDIDLLIGYCEGLVRQFDRDGIGPAANGSTELQ